MPTVRSFIAQLTGKSPCTDINPDTAIAVGAGIFAGIKDRNENLKDVILTDICPFSLGTAIFDEASGENLMSFIIERNTSLPTSRMQTYSAVHDGQKRVKIDIYQGESMLPAKNLLLGELTVDCPPTGKNQPICTVRLTYDINGILIVDVTAVGNNQTLSKTFLSKNNAMSEYEIKKCSERMEKLKISPAENEENRMLIARAERIFEESLAYERDIIMRRLITFKAALQSGNNHEIRSAYYSLEKLLDTLEN